VSLRKLTNGVEASFRRFVWCDNQICEERDAGGTVIKRFFEHGMKVEVGPDAGIYYYTQDHLGSIRELTDRSGNLRARYSYDPFGHRVKGSGDLDADFGFAGMFFVSETGLSLTRYRVYDHGIGRWLSRDPLPKVELSEGPNLYAYVRNNPINTTDPLGLCCESEAQDIHLMFAGWDPCGDARKRFPRIRCEEGDYHCQMFEERQFREANNVCRRWPSAGAAVHLFMDCVLKGCAEPCPTPPPAKPPRCSKSRVFFQLTFGPLAGPGGVAIDYALGECQGIDTE
jgi:RHS repeat-associated protein